MTQPAIIRLFTLLLFVGMCPLLNAQKPVQTKPPPAPVTTESKPYKILTNGKRITIQSRINLKSLLVWTASGHRMLEQNNLSRTNYSFEISVREKIFFLMILLENGKKYTEKIGISGN